jgi:TyrR family helix-turn-helix protein
MDCLLNYDWPGNIRELENTIERLVVTSMDDCISKDAMGEIKSIQLNPVKNELTSLKAFLEKEESRMLGEAYRMMGSTRKAAAMLRISQSSMVKKMKKYGIEVPN